MAWQDMGDSIKKVAESEPRPTSKLGAIGSIAWLSVLAGVIVAAIFVPGTAFLASTSNKVSKDVVDLPLALQDLPNPQTTRLIASNGKRVAYFYQENRQDVPLKKIAPVMQTAIISIEDYRFYEHGALDLKGTLRALMNNASDGNTQGGSSITQQLVKLTLVQQATTKEQRAAATEVSTARKIRELKLAINYEKKYSKDEILEHYLNIAYFGDGAYGIRAAAYHYFSVSPDKLSTAQAATLAGLVQNPEQFNPRIYPERALQRRNTVLGVMARLGKIPEAEAEELSATPIGLKITSFPNGCVDSEAAFSCDYIRRYLLQEPALGETVKERQAMLERGGLTIKTNIDLSMQKAVNKAVTKYVGDTDKAIGSLALVEPGTGKVRAIGQSRSMGKGKGETYINFSVPRRYGDSNGFQAGSTFKMFTAAAALEDGIPASKSYNSPQTMRIPTGTYFDCDGNGTGQWEVKNSTGAGGFNMVTGLRRSVNTYFAQLERDAGLCETVKMAKRMGIPTAEPDIDKGSPGSYIPSFTLGPIDVSPLDMAAAYATPAAGGMYCEPAPVAEILDRSGKTIKKYKPECKRAMSKKTAATINAILVGLQQPGGFGYSNGTGLSIPSAAKTGTTNDSKAVWYTGYTPEISAASMIAGINKKGQPAGLVGTTLRGTPVSFSQAGGSSLAGPQWKAAMGEIEKSLTPAKFDSVTLPSAPRATKKSGGGDDDRPGRGRGRGGDDD
ncbi:penicillin-binding protein [Aeromicrobium tamlense]|uniref:Membrane peptidoglycan carboxypeptidase n=1 Tax=Aeromicrobium tamlense TaxID=375541 RepID=A0A8I0FT16_9ACTN|nr:MULTISPECIES: transglycosylase domain-containing protein [Aeromicrobium]MBD1269657.1 penicillin-binding protein [Aeromicrobium tamlense]NYI39688.1 membrane peptidoglycan carboxypeptidase [Aeromicrobium tamlense]